MGWASEYIRRLQAGERVSFRPRGNSMSGRIESGQLVTVEPVPAEAIETGDVVLCKVSGAEYLHLVKAKRDGRFQIGNNHGHINGWTPAEKVYGKVMSISP